MCGLVQYYGRQIKTNLLAKPANGFADTSWGTFHLIVDQWQWIANPKVKLEIFESEELRQKHLETIIT